MTVPDEHTPDPSTEGLTDELVSVIIPTHNRAAMLRRTLGSVAEQRHRPIEVVLVDDNSTDDTDAVIEESRALLEDRGIALETRALPERRGPAAARNAALEVATGRLVGFLDSDDLWRPDFLSELNRLLRLHTDCGVAFSGVAAIDADDREIAVRDSELPEGEGVLRKPFERVMFHLPFVTPALLIRRPILDRAGRFDEGLAVASDWELWLRISKFADFAYTTRPLICNRLHSGRHTNDLRSWYAHMVRIWLRHIGDVEDPEARARIVERVQRNQTLLQEQLIRTPGDDDYRPLLENEFTPASVRFRVGRRVLNGPRWLRVSHTRAIDVSRALRR